MERFLNTVRSIDAPFISKRNWEQLHEPSEVGKCRVGGIDLQKPRMRTVMNAVVALAAAPRGFTASQLADRIYSLSGNPCSPTQAAYDLKKLRGKQFVQKIARTRRYEPTPEGLRSMTATLILHDKVIRPVLAGAINPPTCEPQSDNGEALPQPDCAYRAIQLEFKTLFRELGIAV